MQINEYTQYINNMNTIKTTSELTQSKDTVSADTTQIDGFSNMLNDYITQLHVAGDTSITTNETASGSTASDSTAADNTASNSTTSDSDTLAQISENLMNTTSGRKVITSMVESQIMGIVTGSSSDDETSNTLQTLLYGNTAADTLTSLENTLKAIEAKQNTEK